VYRPISAFLTLLTYAGASAAEGGDPVAELDAVTVTATRSERSVLSVPGTASTIDGETIQRQVVRNIKDLIRYEPGVNVSNDPQRFGLAGFNIRGIGGNRVLMQVDGVRLPDAFAIGSFASARRNMVDVDALKSVEIVRGPGSSLYGSDALGGVVSFITKDPRDYLEVFGDAHYESLKLGYNSADDSFMQTATLAGSAGDVDGLLLLTHSEGAETDNKGDNKSRNASRTAPNEQDNRALNVLGKLLYHFNADNTLRLTGDALLDDVATDVLSYRGFQGYTGRRVHSLLADDRQSRWRLTLDQAVGKLGWLAADTLTWRVYGQQSATRQLSRESRSTLLGEDQYVRRVFTYDNAMVGGDLVLAKEFATGPGRHRLTYGVEASHTDIEELRDGSLLDLATGEITNNVTPDVFPVRDFPLSETLRAAAFVQDETQWFDGRLEVIPGLRFDYYRLSSRNDPVFAADSPGIEPAGVDATEFSPKVGVLLHLTDLFTLHGQYAEGFRAPNFSDVNSGFSNFAFGYVSLPNPGLKPETSDGGEIGLRGEGAAGAFDATFFRNDYQNFIQSVVVCDPSKTFCPPNNFLTYQSVNEESVEIQGFEFKGQFYFDWLHPALAGFSAVGSYAYAEGENLKTGKPINSVNPMKGVIGLRYEAPSGNWGTEAILTLVAPKKVKDIDFDTAGQVFPTEGYGVLDFTAFYRVGSYAALNLGLFNVLDKKYFDWEDVRGRGSDPHAGLGPQYDIKDRYSRPGRNVGVSLSMAF
jgi:hemoglobin/transferrin/lactoferrin receptor protein